MAVGWCAWCPVAQGAEQLNAYLLGNVAGLPRQSTASPMSLHLSSPSVVVERGFARHGDELSSCSNRREADCS